VKEPVIVPFWAHQAKEIADTAINEEQNVRAAAIGYFNEYLVGEITKAAEHKLYHLIALPISKMPAKTDVKTARAIADLLRKRGFDVYLGTATNMSGGVETGDVWMTLDINWGDTGVVKSL
jgi:hypothetical protein